MRLVEPMMHGDRKQLASPHDSWSGACWEQYILGFVVLFQATHRRLKGIYRRQAERWKLSKVNMFHHSHFA